MKKNNNIFWVGYSDLMTSIFFIMLVLFIITAAYLKNQTEATKKQLKKIEELQTAVKKLPKDYFEYQPKYKRFKLKRQIQFDKGKAIIKPEYIKYLVSVGNSINDLLDSLNANKEYRTFDIKYLVVIEGMASRDNYKQNFELSYERALSLYKLWKSKINGIIFNPNYCAIQIAGSGTDGIREYKNENEYKNQQFLIQIVPKMGKIGDK